MFVWYSMWWNVLRKDRLGQRRPKNHPGVGPKNVTCEGLAWERRKFSGGLVEKVGTPPLLAFFVVGEVGDELSLLSVSREGEGRGGAKREECKDWKLPFQRVEEEKLTGKCG